MALSDQEESIISRCEYYEYQLPEDMRTASCFAAVSFAAGAAAMKLSEVIGGATGDSAGSASELIGTALAVPSFALAAAGLAGAIKSGFEYRRARAGLAQNP